jgi:site-specific recombinase XerD
MAASSVDLPASFERHLRAENKSARTVETYLEAVQQLDAFLLTRGVDLVGARREDLEAFLAGLLARWRPATAANRYRALRVFYAWLEDEGEIPVDPMAKMKPPRVPDQPAPVLTEDMLRRLLATCAGRDFEARRDRALILLLLDTGGRRAEIAGMRLGDVNFEYDVVIVVGKGGRERALPFGNRTGKAIDQYLRARARHPHADLEWFWIGLQGARNRLRHRVAPSPPGSGSRNRKSARPPSSPHLRPSLARPGWRRNRPHAVGGLDVSGDATAPRSPTSAPARPIGAFRQQTGCFH